MQKKSNHETCILRSPLGPEKGGVMIQMVFLDSGLIIQVSLYSPKQDREMILCKKIISLSVFGEYYNLISVAPYVILYPCVSQMPKAVFFSNIYFGNCVFQMAKAVFIWYNF